MACFEHFSVVYLAFQQSFVQPETDAKVSGSRAVSSIFVGRLPGGSLKAL